MQIYDYLVHLIEIHTNLILHSQQGVGLDPRIGNVIREGHTNGGHGKCLRGGYGSEVWTYRMGPRKADRSSEVHVT